MNPTAWPRAQRLQSAVAELASAEAATDPRLRRGAVQRALALEPMVALSQRWSRALAPLLAGLPVAPGAGPGRRFLVVTSEPFAAESVAAHHKNFFGAIRGQNAANAGIDLAVRVQTVISLAEISERTGVMCYFDAQKRLIHDGTGREIKPLTYGANDLS